MSSLQQILLDTTRTLHQRIEANPFMDALTHNKPLEKPYYWLLLKLECFSREGENKLRMILNNSYGFEIESRCRTRLLHEDLNDLGITPGTFNTADFETIDTVGKAIGLLYVLEGSRKGGTFLSTLLKTKAPHLPMRYLRGYGETTDIRWEKFLYLLEQYHNGPIQDEILTGAIRTFEILEEIFHDTE